jgi:uncharacterized alpha-E superfamily protein
MLTRVAANLFQMSRDVERATDLALLCEATWGLQLDLGASVRRPTQLWVPTLSFAADGDLFMKENPTPRPRDIRFHLAFDIENSQSLVSCIRRARRAVQEVRDSVSSEMWEQINRLFLTLARPDLPDIAERDAMEFFRQMRDGLHSFQGLADSTIAHGEAWSYINLGTFQERADNVARILKIQTDTLRGGIVAEDDDSVHWLAVLRSCEAAEPFAQHYSLRIEPRRVVEFVLLNPTFPRSIRFSLTRARTALAAIAGPSDQVVPITSMIGRLCTEMDAGAVDDILGRGIAQYLQVLRTDIGMLIEQIDGTFFPRASPLGYPTDGVETSPESAAQQQQQ